MLKRITHPIFILKKNHFKASLLLSLVISSGYAVANETIKNADVEISTQQTVAGKVTAAGSPVESVTVSLKEDPSKATKTNANGEFTIEAKNGETLVFNAMGYLRVEKLVSTSQMNVELSADEEIIDEVVVTGYSTQKKENISASVVTIDQKKLQDTKSPNISNLLQGKVAGVDVANGTGKPGQGANIRIRGRNSISSGTAPLWVVDGVIAHGTPNINPNDIQTISTLKDAAATTQYGSRGTNGVVIVTTKSAANSGDGIFSVNLSSGVSKFNAGKFELMNSAELWDLYESFPNQTAIPDNITADVVNTDYDWMKNGSQAGWLNDFSASYMGKTEKTSIYSSVNYYDEKGSIKGYDYNRLSGRFNVEHKLSDRLTFKPKINATYTSYEDKQHSLYDMMLYMPWDSPYDDNGGIKNPQGDGSSKYNWYSRDNNNYMHDLQYNYGKGQTFDIQANMDFSYRISDKFTFESMNNVAYYNQTSMRYEDPLSNSGMGNKGTIYQFSDKRIVRFFNQMLKYNETFGKHTVSGFAGYEYSDYSYSSLGLTGKGIAPGTEIVGNAADVLSKAGTKNDYSFQSGIIQGNYGYDDRYNAQVSYRLDGSSRFGKNSQYGSFYAVSGAWNIHNEEFFNSSLINLMRIRASYGSVGNTPTDYYASFSTYGLAAQYNGEPAAILDQFQNANVSWEKAKDANIGLELGLFGRVNLTVDLYNKNIDQLLYYVEFPSTAGWSGYWQNIGSIRNKGVEVAVNGDLFKPESAFQWNLGVNFAHNNNRITSLLNDADIPKGDLRQFSVGRDIDSWYMRKWSGVNPEDGAPLWEVIDPATGEVSTTSNYNEATRQFVGTGTPKLQGGIASSMNYKGFSLNASLAFLTGAQTYNMAREYFDSDGAYPSFNQISFRDDWSRWTPENTNATHPVASYNNNSGSNKISSRYLEDASYIRLRNVTLSYNFAEEIASKLKMKGLGLFLSADNLWTATKFSGLDPESAMVGNDNAVDKTEGDAISQYPAPKRFIFGLNLTF